MRILLTTLLIVFFHSVGQGQDPILALLGKEWSQANLIGISDDGLFEFQFENDRQRYDAKSLLYWGDLPIARPLPCLLLSDGSRIAVASRRDFRGLDNDLFVLDAEIWGRNEIPVEHVQAIVFSPENTPQAQFRRLSRIQRLEPNSDMVELDSGDKLSGNIQKIDLDHIHLDVAQTRIKIEIDQVRVVVFNSNLLKQNLNASFAHFVALKDGSLLRSQSIRLSSQQIQIRLNNGVKLQSESYVRPVDEKIIRLIQPSGNHIQYLSDLQPLGYKHEAFLSLPWPYGVDANLLDTPLMVNGRQYLKGIAMHSKSRLVYAVPQEAIRFEAEMAMDDASQEKGDAVCQVLVERKKQWSVAYTRPQLRGDSKMTECRVDTSDATAIALFVDYGNLADEKDHVDWLNARFIFKDSVQD